MSDDNPEYALRWSVERRLAFISDRLVWEGRINRADLVARFGISPNQATADLRRFEAAHPGAFVYDTRAKTYRAGPAIGAPDAAQAADLLRELRLIAEGVLLAQDGALSAPPPVGLAEAPLRRVAPLCLQRVVTAIRERRMLTGGYRSMSSLDPRRRVLEPHALIFDGFRWHMRAFDRDDGAFKDFVLGRLSEPVVENPAQSQAEDDVDWQEIVELVVVAHPGLPAAAREAIEMDYGMTGGQLRLTCRKALTWYVKRRLGLIPGHENLPPQDQQIVLRG
jgi:hypothetical protein